MGGTSQQLFQRLYFLPLVFQYQECFPTSLCGVLVSDSVSRSSSSSSAASLSHTTLSHTIFHTRLCHNSVTHTHTPLCHTQLCLSHAIFHTHNLSHIQLCHTFVCHTPLSHATWHLVTSTFVLRGWRGTFRYPPCALRCFAWQGRRFQTSSVLSGNYGTGLALVARLGVAAGVAHADGPHA